MKTTTEQQEQILRDAMAKTAIDRGREELAGVKAVLLRAVEELERYERQYEEATTHAERADVLSFAVNHLASNVLGNCRLDLMVTTGYRLGQLG